jgi:hypothetical protein
MTSRHQCYKAFLCCHNKVECLSLLRLCWLIWLGKAGTIHRVATALSIILTILPFIIALLV